jgi:hypothetical protein
VDLWMLLFAFLAGIGLVFLYAAIHAADYAETYARATGAIVFLAPAAAILYGQHGFIG